jgi:predicted permease
MSDLRLALRRVRQTPIVSVAIVLSLGLGVGVTTAIFSLLNGLLLRPLAVSDPYRLVTLSSNRALQHGLTTGLGWNLPIWRRMQERAAAFDGALAWTSGNVPAGEGSERESAYGLFTSGTFFTTLGVQAHAGRLYGVSDDVQGGGPDGPVAVISDRLWDRRFGRDRRAIGSRLILGNGLVTIVGVTPDDFNGIELGRTFDVAIPLGIEPAIRDNESAVRAPNQFLLTFMLRLKPNQSIAAAEAAVQAMQPDLIAGMSVPRMAEEPIRLVPAGNGADRYRYRWNYQQPLLAIFVAAALALLMACATIANLMLARASARTHEISVRLALGAVRTRLLRQMLAESGVLAGGGALVGLLVAWWATRATAAFLAGSWTIDAGPSLDWRVLGFAAIVAGIATLLFGAAPAALVTRAAPAEVLNAHDRRAGGGGSRTSGSVVIAQVAMSLVLVVLTGLFVGTFGRLARLPLGFLGDRILIVDVQTDRAMPAAERNDFAQRLVQAAASTPGVAAAAGSRLTPLSHASNSLWAEQRDIDLQNAVTPGWFATYGTPFQAGRDFDGRDTATSQPVAIVNEAYGRKHFPDRSPLGEAVRERTIVGVVGDAVFSTVRAGIRPTVYEPLTQPLAGPRGPRVTVTISISVRPASGAPVDIARAVTTSLSAVSQGATLTVRPLSDDVAASIAQERLLAMLSGLFAVLALALAGLGLYGLMSNTVTRRTNEIGVRIALGASPGDIVRLILGRALFVIALGILLGALGAVWVSGLVGSLLYGLGSRDTATFAAAATVLGAVGLMAAWFPARRAAGTDPAKTLRAS